MSQLSSDHPVPALTLGEPSGIAPDITIETWLARTNGAVPPFLFVGPSSVLEDRAARMGKQITTVKSDPQMARQNFRDAIPCLADDWTGNVEPGQPNARNAAEVIKSIDRSVALVRSGQCSSVVTNPIQKESLAAFGFAHRGHTEFLGELALSVFGVTCKPVMMLAASDLRTVPITVHVSLREAISSLSSEMIVETGLIVASDLSRYFGIDRPRLVVAGLNPHAGEGGLMGEEEQQIVEPAVRQLIAQGVDARGPMSADTMFHGSARRTYDAALCMYHDQALIPVKTLAFETAVNVTLGLPFIRTSPDHGTALDIVGSGKASASSLIAALQMAETMAGKKTVQ